MKHPTPVLALLRRARRANRGLAIALDKAKHDAAVQKARADRWRRTALEMAPRVGPKAMSVCLMQCQSEEIADLPETKEHR